MRNGTGTISRRAAREALRPIRERYASSRLAGMDEYARDPVRLLREGLVRVLDLKTLQVVRLIPWPHQVEVIEAWVDVPHLQETGELRFRNVHEEKSRQMGLTWITAYVLWWALNFHNVPLLALSRKLGEICDSGPTTDSLFGRIRFIHERVPLHLRSPLVWVGGNDPAIRNPIRTSAFLSGEGATPDAGRGGKYAAVFLDEAARIPWGRLVHSAVSRACPAGRFYNSTPKGEDDLYFWLRDTRPAGYEFLRHHWSVNPAYNTGLHVAAIPPRVSEGIAYPGQHADQPPELLAVAESCERCAAAIEGVAWDAEQVRAHRYPGRLTSEWYDMANVELTDEQVAEELDIDYTGSLPARVYAEFSEERHVRELIPYDPALPVMLSFDYGWAMTAVGIWQDAPLELRKIAEFEGSDLIPEQVASGIRANLRAIGVPEVELGDFNTLTWLAVGDPAGDAHNMATGRTLTEDYRAAGFNITSQRRSIDSTITAVKRVLQGVAPKRLLISRQTCPASVRHFKNNQWPVDRNGNRKPDAREPLNNEHNHMCRADAYLISHLCPPPSPGLKHGLQEPAERPESGLSYDMTF
jgi:hypothetical protein